MLQSAMTIDGQYSILVKPASADCTMSCSYCFYREDSAPYPESTPGTRCPAPVGLNGLPATLAAMAGDPRPPGAAEDSHGIQPLPEGTAASEPVRADLICRSALPPRAGGAPVAGIVRELTETLFRQREPGAAGPGA
jgi:hypothetical protein